LILVCVLNFNHDRALGENASLEVPEHYQNTMIQAQAHFEQAIVSFRKKLAKIPIGAEIENWLQGLIKERKAECEKNMRQLIKFGVIKLTHNGKIRTLNDLSSNEYEIIIEQIRCVPKLTISEKEESVRSYIEFSQHVSRITCRLIPPGQDLDFLRTLKKIVTYNEFIKFVQLLAERDALVAKLLYFGAPTMDEVLNLNVGQVNVKEDKVKFHKFSVKYPKHVMLELKDYLSKKEKNELIFTNLHGERIERTHLNNCFNRASRKTFKNKRITPKMLLESDFEESLASEPMFASLPIQ